MKRMLMMAMLGVVGLTLTLADVQAKRAGGGKSIGRQSQQVTPQRDTTKPAQNSQSTQNPPQNSQTPPSQQAAPGAANSAQPGAAAAPGAPAAAAVGAGAAATAGAAAKAAAPAAVAQTRNRWLGPVAGLAAGLGLAALASHLGFGEEFGSLMMMVLFAIVAIAALKFFLARRAAARGPSNFALGAVSPGAAGSVVPAAQFERNEPALKPQADTARWMPPSGGTQNKTAASVGVPADFDTAQFLTAAKRQFSRMQADFDARNLADLREFTTDEMYQQLKVQINDRHGEPNHTEVVTLEAELLGVESTLDEQLASVRFVGSVREQPGASAESFDETWNFVRPLNRGGGWVLAGIQQMA